MKVWIRLFTIHKISQSPYSTYKHLNSLVHERQTRRLPLNSKTDKRLNPIRGVTMSADWDKFETTIGRGIYFDLPTAQSQLEKLFEGKVDKSHGIDHAATVLN